MTVMHIPGHLLHHFAAEKIGNSLVIAAFSAGNGKILLGTDSF